jgi:hypothetical protein
VSRWQIVEIHLFRIFARLMRCADGGSASVAFHAVANFRAKLSMVDGIAKYSFPTKKPEMAAWEALNKRAIARSKRRNMLAHYTITFGVYSDFGPGGAPPKPHEPGYFGPFLVPSIVSARGHPSRKLTISSITNIAKSFDRLAIDINDFANSLPAPAPSASHGIWI